MDLIADQAKELKKLKRWQYYLKKKCDELLKKIDGGDLTYFVNKVLKGMHFEKRAALVLDMEVSGELFGDAVKEVTIFFGKKGCVTYLQRGAYVRPRILRTKVA